MNRKNIFVIALIMILMSATLLIGCSGSGDENVSEAEQQTTTVVKETDNTVNPSEEKITVAASYEKPLTEKPTEKITATQPTTKPAAPASKPTTNPTTKPTEAEKMCYITIDGYCSSKQIQIKGGESVYDILKATGVSVSARTTGYGLYVEGINGRFEFDEGPTSGWVYTVNGSRVSKSCDKCEVNPGDKIVWTYVEEI